MTKAELLTTLANKFYRVEMPTQQADYGGLKWYLVKIYDLNGNALRDMNIAFYVQDEGLPTEAAYWSPAEPKPPMPPTGFQQDFQVYVSQKIVDGTIKGAFIETVDALNENAIVKAILNQAGTYVEKRLFIWRTAGVFSFKQIG